MSVVVRLSRSASATSGTVVIVGLIYSAMAESTCTAKPLLAMSESAPQPFNFVLPCCRMTSALYFVGIVSTRQLVGRLLVSFWVP